MTKQRFISDATDHELRLAYAKAMKEADTVLLGRVRLAVVRQEMQRRGLAIPEATFS